MKDWQSRVLKEACDLKVKLDKLNDYLYSPHPTILSPVDFGLLMVQQRAMTMYSDVLTTRIESFNND